MGGKLTDDQPTPGKLAQTRYVENCGFVEERTQHGTVVWRIQFADGTRVAYRRNTDPDAWALAGSLDTRNVEPLIARAHTEFGGDHRFRLVRKLLRRRANENKAKEWDQVLTGAVRDWAYSRLEELKDGEPCCDNSRVALRGNTSQVRRYNHAKASGCCGFCDVVEVCPVDGKTYLLGFNYGH